MVNKEYIEYLVRNVLFLPDNAEISILDEVINISVMNNHYSESLFTANQGFNTHEISILDSIIHTEGHLPHHTESVPYLKLIHFFISEQYLIKPNILDVHGRISAKSVNPKYLKFLEIPIVDILISIFYRQIQLTRNKNIKIILSSDFDFTNLWSKLGFLRSIKRLSLLFFTLKLTQFSRELNSYLSDKKNLDNNLILRKDLFTLDLNKVPLKKYAFWLVNNRNAKYDFENDFSSPSLKEYIKYLLVNNVEFGLHPSYNSSSDFRSINTDINLFKEIFKKKPVISRYHFLKYKYPDDLLVLEKSEIKEDYSYCFSDSFFFRGGRAFALKPWSFKENRMVDVMSYPITLMDVIFKYSLNLSFKDATRIAKQKIRLTLDYGSDCVLLWHNNYLYKLYEKNNYQPELYQFIKNYLKEYFDNKDNS